MSIWDSFLTTHYWVACHYMKGAIQMEFDLIWFDYLLHLDCNNFIIITFQTARQLGRLIPVGLHCFVSSPADKSCRRASRHWLMPSSNKVITTPGKFGKRALSLKKQFQQTSMSVFLSPQWSQASHGDTLQIPSANWRLYSAAAALTSLSHLLLTFLVLISMPVRPPLPRSDSRAWPNQLNKVSRYGENKSTIVRGFLSLSISSRTLEATCHLL